MKCTKLHFLQCAELKFLSQQMEVRGFKPGTIPGGVSDALLANQRLSTGIFCVVQRQGRGRVPIRRVGKDRRGCSMKKLAFAKPLL